MMERNREPSANVATPERKEAERMLEAFQSVGADRFDLTLTTLESEKALFQRGVSYRDLYRKVSDLLMEADGKQQNVIVRPLAPPPVFLLQLDDLNETGIKNITPHAFLTVETSPGNFQAWIALAKPDEEFCRQLRRGLEADPTASGATRLAGSRNFKAHYAPDFPCVKSVHLSLGRFTDREALEGAGIVAQSEKEAITLPSRSIGSKVRRRTFPDYQRCLDGAPGNHGGTGADRSRADFTFCLLAIDWGFDAEETAERLLQVSKKAQENGARYALRTAKRAEEVIRRRGKPSSEF